jgi:UDP-N-acetylglucosamine--N-acetylmuramyl-(pentapeptide) pyrophosphoryl-undecaprenol N-acetylglucosamine transferase
MTALFVATTGGHLAQLFELSGRMKRLGPHRLWVTFDSEQGRTLLAGEDRVFIPYIAERDVVGVCRAWACARRLMADMSIEAVVSTGSAIALSFLPHAVLKGAAAHYIESAARVDRPSLTGRLLQRVPGVRIYRQYQHVATGRWRYGGSVFDGYGSESIAPRAITKVVVTVGMERSFRRLIERVSAILPAGIEVLWQTGPTPVDDLAIDATPFVPAAALARAMAEADVVISHAGCGSALMALGSGRFPVLVARDPGLGEVVDRHQMQIADWLRSQQLALQRSIETLTFADLETAAARVVRRSSDPPPFELGTP